MGTSSPPSTRQQCLMSRTCSHHSHHLYIIPWSRPSLLPLVICLSSHQHALITAIPSSSVLLVYPPSLLSLVICFSYHDHALITAIIFPSSPGHLLPSFHWSSVSHVHSMLSPKPSPLHHSLGTSCPLFQSSTGSHTISMLLSQPSSFHHPPGQILPAFYSSSISYLPSMLSSHPSPAHRFLATSFPTFTRQLSLISLAGYHHSHRQLIPSGPPPVLPLVICLSSALFTAITSSSFPAHILSSFHSSYVSHLIIML